MNNELKAKFFENEKDPSAKRVYERIVRDYKPIESWDNSDLNDFLCDSNFTSISSAEKYLSIVRKIHKFVCEYKKIVPKELKPLKDNMISYINFEKLRAKTIVSWDELVKIRNSLIYRKDNKEFNFRDAVLLELAWKTLTSEEISNLKEREIEEYFENGKRRLRLHLAKRTILVDEDLIINDILAAKNEREYIKVKFYSGELKEDILPYVESPFLIKGSNNGRAKSGMPVSHPKIMIQNRLRKLTHPVLDMEHLSLEDVRRSYIFNLIYKGATVDDIKQLLGKNQINDLYKLNKIALKLREYSHKYHAESSLYLSNSASDVPETPTASDSSSIGTTSNEYAERIELKTYRYLRDTKLARKLKSKYFNKCQICGTRICFNDEEFYSEAHHIRPLGSGHNGPDIEGNILVLCPNHHAEFDYGVIAIEPNSLVIRHINPKNEYSGQKVKALHDIDKRYLRYHLYNIFKGIKP